MKIGSIALFKDKDTDIGVISTVDNFGGDTRYWSAWQGYAENSWSQLKYLTLVGPQCLGSWLK